MRAGWTPLIALVTLPIVLAATAGGLAAAPAPTTDAAKAKAEAIARQQAAQLNAKQAQALAAKNRKIRAVMARLRSSGAPVAPASTPLTSGALMSVRAYRPGGANPATLTSLIPNPVTVGGRATLNGRLLGDGRGRVDLVFVRAMVSVACSVASWSASRVVVTVPAGIGALVGDRGEDVLFWVKTAGREDGPSLAGRVVASSLPTITGTSDSVIEPGQLLIVQGSGFGTASGQARLRFASLGQTRDAIVDSWADTAAVVHLDEGITGLPREVPCALELTNASGRTATRDITFHATLVYEVLTQTIEHWTEPTDGWQHWTDNPFFRETLHNGWQAFSVGISLVTDADYTSCEILSRPPTGSESLMSMSVRTGANGYGHYVSVTCNAWAAVNGPRGSSYHGASVVPPTP
jgi:hypothetical protein